jgi:NNP family nitrate/nitrite transporter-like MFS transporter
MLLALLGLSAPQGHIVLYVPEKVHAGGQVETMRFVMGPVLFTFLVFIVGCGMGIGKAAVYKHIPEYFPNDVGAVGGLVGLFGALGGFFLPLLFAYSFKATGIPQTTFAILFLVTLASAIWMHLVVMKLLKLASPHLEHVFDSPH